MIGELKKTPFKSYKVHIPALDGKYPGSQTKLVIYAAPALVVNIPAAEGTTGAVQDTKLVIALF